METPATVMDNSGITDAKYEGAAIEYQMIILGGELKKQLAPLERVGWEVCTISRGDPNPLSGEVVMKALLMRIKPLVVAENPDAEYFGTPVEHQVVNLRGDLLTALSEVGLAGWRVRAVMQGPPNPITLEPNYQVLVVRTVVVHAPAAS